MTKIEDWLKGQLAVDIWNKKYRYENESFDQWLDRVSGGDKDVKKLILDKKFLFGGRILANRGTGMGTTSNCFVIETGDSIEKIYNTAKDMAIIFKAGGGVGVDLSPISPAGARINNPAKTTSGVISFIDLFTNTASTIGTNGRRAALMLSLACDHPDIKEFIELKTDVNKATSANLSIKISDKFMKAVENEEEWYCAFTRKETGECISKSYKARELFKIFCDANYDYGEPGMIFWDNVNKNNLYEAYNNYAYSNCNPCGEQMLPNGGACLLGSMNLSEYVKSDMTFDFTGFSKDVAVCMRALDDVLSEGIEYLPLSIQREIATNWRQVGLGIMGLGDMLIKMNIPYGSQKSLRLCDEIGACMARSAITASIELGHTRGSFPKFKPEKTMASSFYKNHIPSGENFECTDMRNSQVLCIAPTGSLSTMLGISGGIEPLFALDYDRTTKSLDGKDMVYRVTPDVVQYARDKGLLEGLVSSADIDYKNRVAMQAVWQKHIDNAISSTINIPKDFPQESIGDIYMFAWKSGLKGVTVFRDGCKREGILTKEKNESSLEDQELLGVRRKIVTGCGSIWLLAYMTPDNKIREIFISKGSSGSCEKSLVGLSRTISLALRNGISLEKVVDQLNSCGSCPSYMVRRATKGDTSQGTCCPSAIGQALIKIEKEFNPPSLKYNPVIEKEKVVNPCPICGAELVYTNGCVQCNSCLFTQCN